MADGKSKKQQESPAFEFVCSRLANAFGFRTSQENQKFRDYWRIEEHRDNMNRFLVEENIEQIIVQCSGPGAILYSVQSETADWIKQRKAMVVLKLVDKIGLDEGDMQNEITKEDMNDVLIFMEMTKNPLKHMHGIFQQIFMPLLHNEQNSRQWTELVSKDLIERFNNYQSQTFVTMGQIKGQTQLPTPPHKLTSGDNISEKDKAHVFEGCVIMWTKQIKNILKLEPEQALKNGHPNPKVEINFWKNKSENLDSIHLQLQSEQVKKILKFLLQSKSTYYEPFKKLEEEVKQAKIEANDSYTFVNILDDWFEQLNNTSDFQKLHHLFVPIMHTILLIWQNSKYYNTPSRLVVLIREICNAIIEQAREYVSGAQIFQLLEEKPIDASKKLQTTIDVCTKFKDAYFEYKGLAENQWQLTTNALFVRLDNFLERCHDILDLTKTITQFNKLDNIFIGGTKGKTLTETVSAIYDKFQEAVDNFKRVEYDIMDIDEREFDTDFYKFRNNIKELERRLASVLTQGFDDSDTIFGRFKLLDSFESLLNRPHILDELEKKHIILIESYKQDLKLIQIIFTEGKELCDKLDEKNPIYRNMPPVAGTLTWTKGLKERIKETYVKLSSFSKAITEREEFKDAEKLYNSLNKNIEEYENSKITDWETEVESYAKDKLKHNILARDEDDLLKVNFDKDLIKMLKEVKYFYLLDRPVPQTASEIYKSDNCFKTQICQLDIIVGQYNRIVTCLHPVERPLIQSRIDKMNEVLNDGLVAIKWEDENKIFEFVDKVKGYVQKVTDTVDVMKASLGKINSKLDNDVKNTICKYTPNKNPKNPEDYYQEWQAAMVDRWSSVRGNYKEIQKSLKEISDQIRVDKSSKEWNHYREYINDIVINGQINAIFEAMRSLLKRIQYTPGKVFERQIFEIKMILSNKTIEYDPPIEELQRDSDRQSVRNSITGWIEDYMQICNLFKMQRLDLQQGDYLTEIRDSFEIRGMMSKITKTMDLIESDCLKYIGTFEHFSDLWKYDPDEHFEKFLLDEERKMDDFAKEMAKDDLSESEVVGDLDHLQENSALLKGAKARIPPLETFDEIITELENKRREIQQMTDIKNIGWLKIIVSSLRDSLKIKVQKWINVYTNFLLTQVKVILTNLQNFNKNTADGIVENPNDHPKDKDLLRKVMKIISDNEELTPQVEIFVDKIKGMVELLKQHQVPLEDQQIDIVLIDQTKQEFNESKQVVLTLKEDIYPLQQKEGYNIKQKQKDFVTKLNGFEETFKELMPFRFEDNATVDHIKAAYRIIDEYRFKIKELQKESIKQREMVDLFGIERAKKKQIKNCRKQLTNLKLFWDSISLVTYYYDYWEKLPWQSIPIETLTEVNKNLGLQIKRMPKEVVKGRFQHKKLQKKVKEMQTLLPLISNLLNPAMQPRHWTKILKLSGKYIDTTSPSTTFKDIILLKLHNFENEVNEIVDIAQKELKINKQIKEIKKRWNRANFNFKMEKDVPALDKLDDLQEELEIDQMQILSLSAQGKYVVEFKDELDKWRQILSNIDSSIEVWLDLQKMWSKLVNIFMDTDDIRQNLPDETKLFEQVDGDWRDCQSSAINNPGVVDNCTKAKIASLNGMFDSISKCEAELTKYLEIKKKVFPRFYFLAPEALLDILSNGNQPVKVEKYLNAVFNSLSQLEFLKEKDPTKIINKSKGMYSKEHEYVAFDNGESDITVFEAKGEVENWLCDLEYMMRISLQSQIGHAWTRSLDSWQMPNMSENDLKRDKWIELFCAQIALIITLIVWTEDTQRAIDELENGTESAIKDLLSLINDRISQLILRVKAINLTKLLRNKFITVITVDVHGRDVISNFNSRRPPIESDSFDWMKQLRYYYREMEPYELEEQSARQHLRFPWEKDENCKKVFINIVDWKQFYGYEYIGNCGRLVITNLTDRCYITLTQALNLKMGGAPAGPAGTGKTETTKDLGGAIGIQVLVTNCSDQFTVQSCMQFFMGLSSVGGWGCFDEFNRISIEVLSVVSTQVSQILANLRARNEKFLFMDSEEVKLVDTVGFFITMNPGYAGRTELPENLKAQFRDCAMVVPDFIPICENMLMAEGFQEAKMLSRKFICLYMLSLDLLSKQIHYDWKLRAIKSVLRMAGSMLRESKDGLMEEQLLRTGLEEFNIAKITVDDQPIFRTLILCLFPGVDMIERDTNTLNKQVRKASTELGYQPEEGFVLKVIQTKEILVVRHCMFIIGPPGSGKTSVWKCLAKQEENEGHTTACQIINPKSIDSNEMFGYMTPSLEWQWGVFSTVMDKMSQEIDAYRAKQHNKWIILDGIVDTIWIESLNTVMDDNKVLTLVSNARIPLRPSMRLLFEVANLENATLATVTRGGVLFINASDIGWKPYMESWLNRDKYRVATEKSKSNNIYKEAVPAQFDQQAFTIYSSLFEKFFATNYRYFQKCSYIAPVNEICQVMATCNIIDALLGEHYQNIVNLEEEQKREAYQRVFLFGAMWGIGGAVGGGENGLRAQKEFSNNFKSHQGKTRFPDEEGSTVFDYYYNSEINDWQRWDDQVKPYEHPEDEDFLYSKILVHSVQTCRLQKLCEYHVSRRKPVLFIGNCGTGKTVVIKDFLNHTDPDHVSNANMNFNSYTSARDVQNNLELKLINKTKEIKGCLGAKILVYFVDDMNMQSPDDYGTQTTAELLRQIHDSGEVFDRLDCQEKRKIADVLLFGCQNPKAGSFKIDLRLQRHFTVFAFMVPGDDILFSIYSKIINGHLENFGGKDYHELGDRLVKSLISFYNQIMLDAVHFSPSGDRFTYQFNLRELSKVFEGCLQSRSKIYKGSEGAFWVKRLFVHEVRRVFFDRCISTDDIDIMQKYLEDAMGGDNFQKTEVDSFMEEPLVYQPFTYEIKEGEFAVLPVQSWEELKAVLEEKLSEYNETNIVMNLVLFKDAMCHVCRIVRILFQPGGNALLVGVGGSGKQSLARLASYILGYDTQGIVVTSNFKLIDLETELQTLFTKCTKPSAGPRCFKITDQQIIIERMLVYINDMLSSGYIAGLFTNEDIQAMAGNLRQEMKGEGIVETPQNLLLYWMERLKANMHTILCFSPVGDPFRIRARKFPGLISCAMIDYFHSWPPEALYSVGMRYLKDTKFSSEELRSSIATDMSDVHISIKMVAKKFLEVERRSVFTTPKSFLEFKDYYNMLLKEKRQFIQNKIERLEKGLDIISETNSRVVEIKADVAEIAIKVEKETKETEILIQKVGKEANVADKEKADAEVKAKETNLITEAALNTKAKADAALAEAIPALEKAKAAVGGLTPKNISDMTGIQQPTQGVCATLIILMILFWEWKFKIKKVDFNDHDAMKKTYKQGLPKLKNAPQFLKILVAWSGNQAYRIPEDVKARVNAEIANMQKAYGAKWGVEKCFVESVIQKKGCTAASKICSFINNILQFNKIYLFVKPLQEEMEASTQLANEKQAELKEIEDKVAGLVALVNELEEELAAAVEKKERVEAEARACQNKLNRAEQLVNGLANENKRWGNNVVSLKQQTTRIVGDALLAAAFVSYIPAFSAAFRLKLWKSIWLPRIIELKIPITDQITPMQILTNSTQMAQWQNEDLPNDPMSMENAAIICSCTRWPLLIDPQLQGIQWIRGHCGDDLTVLTLDAKQWMMQLKLGITLGKIVMFEQLKEDIDATLDPLLQRAIVRSGGGYKIEIGGDDVDYAMSFQLYLQTKMLNPYYPPEISAQCTIVNFIVTESGLEEQLLADVVNKEKAELEQKRQQLVKNQNDFQVQLARLEEELLNALQEANPDTILDNTPLIEKLDETKKTSIIIEEKQKEAKITEVIINKEREVFRPVAAEGSMLYFLCIALCVLSHMYAYSLESFKNFFFKAMDETEVKGDGRILALRQKIRYIIFQWVSRGLFVSHKLIFLTLVTFRLMQKKVVEVEFTQQDMDFLLNCIPKTGEPNPIQEWLPNVNWYMVQRLIELDKFSQFSQNMVYDAPGRFKDWFNALNPETENLPLEWKALKDTPFQKLLVLRCLRPDRISIALLNFIRKVLPNGDDFADMDSTNPFSFILEDTFNAVASEPSIPIFFILSKGSDPTQDVINFGQKLGFSIENKKYFQISLGAEMEEQAIAKLNQSFKEGHWLMLQNIHLMPNFLSELEKQLEKISQNIGAGNPQFRLLLSAKPSSAIPIGILDKSIKLSNEPPSGLRANMQRAWCYFPDASEFNDKDSKLKNILFALCYFHSCVIERKRFGKKGWNLGYDFSLGDLRDSSIVLHKYIDKLQSGNVPWDDLRYIFGQIFYGGHIVDDWDRRLCDAYQIQFFNDALIQDELDLYPFSDGKKHSFKCPAPTTYDKYLDHIIKGLKEETPIAYGLHPNAEIDFRTQQCSDIFDALQKLIPKEQSGADEEEERSRDKSRSPNDLAGEQKEIILDDMQIVDKVINIQEIKDILSQGLNPYQNVFVQESQAMNILLNVIIASLRQLDLGLKGQLTISDSMERLIDSLANGKVPVLWQNKCYPSMRGLGSWLQNLSNRCQQLEDWSRSPDEDLKLVQINKLFNPQSYLTAIKQVKGNSEGLELNKLTIKTELTNKSAEEVQGPPAKRDGAHIFGLFVEGARYDFNNKILEDSLPKQMFSLVPVIWAKAVLIKEGIVTGFGLSNDRTVYICPVYKTAFRLRQFVFEAQFNTKKDPRKWILAGVACILDVDGQSEVFKKPK